MSRMGRADLHVHSRHSKVAGSLRFLRSRDCYSSPLDVYLVAKRRGMDVVTITDHDSIDGWRELMDARHVVITSQEAHYIFEYDYNAPPEILWEWFNDPHKRGQWMTSEIVPVLRAKGRNGPGARNHCVHGKHQVTVEDILDVRPYEYFTVAHTPQGSSAALLMTFEFHPVGTDKTHFRLLFKAKSPHTPDWMANLVCQIVLRVQIFKLWKLELINDLLAKEPAD